MGLSAGSVIGDGAAFSRIFLLMHFTRSFDIGRPAARGTRFSSFDTLPGARTWEAFLWGGGGGGDR